MKGIFFLIIYSSLSIYLNAQNVGIGTTSPTEKLDVNGNINVSGTIKTNGVDGLPNQVLMKNSSGSLVWSHLGEYKNFVTITTVGYSDWIVPAGVTKIFVEAWGGGGGSTYYGGGAGGGYVAAVIPVTPGGTVTCAVGAGGTGQSQPTGGWPSGVTFGTYSISAFGGQPATTASSGFNASGGTYYVTAGVTSFYQQAGEGGGSNKFEFYQSGPTTFIEVQTGGKGGDAGNSSNTGVNGEYYVRSIPAYAIVYNSKPAAAKIPGGGAGGYVLLPAGGGSLADGAQGMLIIHY